MERNACRNGDVFQGLSLCRCRLLCRAPFSEFLELKTNSHGDRKSPILEVVGTPFLTCPAFMAYEWG